MAKASKVSKSQMIRDYLAQHPDAGPSEVAEALREFGVSPAPAAFLRPRKKSTAQLSRRKKRPQHEAARTPPVSQQRSGGQLRKFEPVLVAARLIRISGGIQEARAALQDAARLRGDLHEF